jgi:CRISPR system Cascade subunit CasE
MLKLVKINLSYEHVANKKIKDSYAWHKAAWDMFSHHEELKDWVEKNSDGKKRTPFLTRLIQKPQHIELLALSAFSPQQPPWCDDDQWHTLTIDDAFLSQSAYAFDLYANPTRAVKKEDGKSGYTKNGKRLTLLDKESQTAWLQRKAKEHGFQLLDAVTLQIENGGNHEFWRKKSRGLHIGVSFKGALQVTNPGLFKSAYIQGIGTAKSFGFGMLLIKPIQI